MRHRFWHNFVQIAICNNLLLSAAERRGTPVLLSASVSNNSSNSPQMAAPRRSREIHVDQSTQRFHVGCDNGNEYGGLHGREFLGRTFIFTG